MPKCSGFDRSTGNTFPSHLHLQLTVSFLEHIFPTPFYTVSTFILPWLNATLINYASSRSFKKPQIKNKLLGLILTKSFYSLPKWNMVTRIVIQAWNRSCLQTWTKLVSFFSGTGLVKHSGTGGSHLKGGPASPAAQITATAPFQSGSQQLKIVTQAFIKTSRRAKTRCKGGKMRNRQGQRCY